MYYDHEVQLSQQCRYIPAIELKSPYFGAHNYDTAHASNYIEKNARKHKNREVNHYYENIEVFTPIDCSDTSTSHQLTTMP